MTLPPVIRIFFAIELSLDMKKQLADLINQLKKQAKTHSIRWTMPENLHITLQFLPEVRSEDLDLLIQNVRSQLEGHIKTTKLLFNHLELFPNPYRPRVIVLSVASHENFIVMADLIGRGIKATHYEVEDRTFRAHLTLGRIKHPKGINLHFLGECQLPTISGMDINEVVLFRSEPEPEGSKYRVLEKIRF